MCGIFTYLLKNKDINNTLLQECHTRIHFLKNRGPDNYSYILPDKNIFMGFQRLSIVDLSELANQPFTDKYKRATLICNGEIYNSKELTKKYNLLVESNSDCEVILHLYIKYGIQKVLEEIDGVFSFILYDYYKKEIICARDPYGVRPLFISDNKDYLVISSEIKPLYNLDNVLAFPNGCFWSSKQNISKPVHYKYFNKQKNKLVLANCNIFLKNNYIKNSFFSIKNSIKNLLYESVTKRLQSDRKIGCLLSGGLDSSIITALVAKLTNSHIITYSVGLEGSTDLEAARKVASFLGTEHHEIIFTEEQGLQVLSNVIYDIESWDTTTIRASTPMWIMCKYIKENTPDVKVIMSGEGADEVCQGYLYFHNQPSPDEGHIESVRLLKDLLFFDVLRSDRSVSCHGLEVRVPFLDKEFVDYYMSIPPEYRCPDKEKCEKWLLRESFKTDNILPSDILWRKKDGLSDGCSSINRPWYKVIQEYVEKIVSTEELENAHIKYKHCTPKTKESLFFRNIFHKHFPEKDRDTLIPYQWMPKWSGKMNDPSGRLIIT